MSYLKISPNQFLGNQELNFLRESLDEDGYRQMVGGLVRQFGIIRDFINDPTFTALDISQGSSPVKLNISEGYFLDKDLLRGAVPRDIFDTEFEIVSSSLTTDTIPINTAFGIYIEHAYTTEEVGTIDIDVSGNMTGTGTLFESVLRGQPHHAVKIQFTNSVSNLAEYEVLSVASDTVAILSGGAGTFTAEAGLTYKVIGTFDHGIPVPAGSKEIYQRDFYKLILDDVNPIINPAYNDKKFFLGSVFTDGAVMTLSLLKPFILSADRYHVHSNEAAVSSVAIAVNAAYTLTKTYPIPANTVTGLGGDEIVFEGLLTAQEGTGGLVYGGMQIQVDGNLVEIDKNGAAFATEILIGQESGVIGRAVRWKLRLVCVSGVVKPIMQYTLYEPYDANNYEFGAALPVKVQEIVGNSIAVNFAADFDIELFMKYGDPIRFVRQQHLSIKIERARY